MSNTGLQVVKSDDKTEFIGSELVLGVGMLAGAYVLNNQMPDMLGTTRLIAWLAFFYLILRVVMHLVDTGALSSLVPKKTLDVPKPDLASKLVL